MYCTLHVYTDQFTIKVSQVVDMLALTPVPTPQTNKTSDYWPIMLNVD